VAGVSNDAVTPAEALARQFQELSPADQELVIALVTRLQSSGSDDSATEYPRDVSFMDFDQ